MKKVSLKQLFESCAYYDLQIVGGGSSFVVTTFQKRPCGTIRNGKAEIEEQFIVAKQD